MADRPESAGGGPAGDPVAAQPDPVTAAEADRARLEQAVRDRTTALVAAREAGRAARLEAEQARRERDAAEAKLARVAGHPLVRVGIAGLRAVRTLRDAAADIRIGGGASPLAERTLTRRLLAQLPTGALTDGPRVLVVVSSGSGPGRLRRLLTALEDVAYRNLEIVVVEGGSTDGSGEHPRGPRSRHPLRMVRVVGEDHVADAINAAVEDTSAELVLFLRDDVLPLDPQWLGWMVASVLAEGTVACGTRLVLPRRRHGRSEGPDAQPDLELLHAGIHFDWVDGMPRPRSIGGPDPTAEAFLGLHQRPAASAACLLVRSAAFVAVGGFDPAYVDGDADVDLCLRLRAAGGAIVVDGRATLWRDEAPPRRRDLHSTNARQRANRAAFSARWGRTLLREVAADADEGRWFLSAPSTFSAAIAGPPDARPALESLRAALARTGWPTEIVSPGGPLWPASAGVVVVTDPGVDIRVLPRGCVTIAWIDGSVEAWLAVPWVDHFDLILVADDAAAEAIRTGTAKVARRATSTPTGGSAEDTAATIRTEHRAWVDRRRVGILIQVDDWEHAPTSGDYHFARALQRQFERRGMPTSVYFRPDWKAPASTRDDIVIHLWGRYPLGRRPGQISLLWILYHPELVTDDLLLDYDLVLVASDRFAADVASRTTVPVAAVHQATDPERFRPDQPGPAHELLFVGNSRGVRRPILDDVTPTRHDLAVYGGGWTPDLLDPAHLRGSSVANEDVPGYYGQAAIVLNDHWQEAADGGFLNNRLYDALGAGGFVISDRVEGIRPEFDDGVVTYRDAADLFQLVEHFLAEPAERAAHAERGRRAVLERHTFAQRADQILALVDRLDVDGPARPTRPGKRLDD